MAADETTIRVRDPALVAWRVAYAVSVGVAILLVLPAMPFAWVSHKCWERLHGKR